MDWFESQISGLVPPDMLIHVGAGSGVELDVYRKFRRTRVILVEPDPKAFVDLSAKVAGLDHIVPVQAAVSSRNGEARLRRFNVSRFNSLGTPTALLDLFPGLKTLDVVTVPVITLDGIVDRFGVADFRACWLVLGAPGAETSILNQLTETVDGTRFSHVFLRGGARPLFDGDLPLAQLLGRLKRRGYELAGPVDETDPDRPRCHMHLNEQTRECAEFSRRVSSLRHRVSELSSVNDALNARIDRYEQCLDDVRGTLEKRLEVRGPVEEMKEALSTSLRIQALREADLEDIQSRYSKSIRQQDMQLELLEKLGRRLENALASFAQSSERYDCDEAHLTAHSSGEPHR